MKYPVTRLMNVFSWLILLNSGSVIYVTQLGAQPKFVVGYHINKKVNRMIEILQPPCDHIDNLVRLISPYIDGQTLLWYDYLHHKTDSTRKHEYEKSHWCC